MDSYNGGVFSMKWEVNITQTHTHTHTHTYAYEYTT